MIVNRPTWKITHLHHEELIELLEAMLETQGKTPRVCSYVFGDRDTVTSGLHYGTMADREQDIADFNHDRSEGTKLVEKHPDLAETGMTSELLLLQ
jgi:hypothetical protein